MTNAQSTLTFSVLFCRTRSDTQFSLALLRQSVSAGKRSGSSSGGVTSLFTETRLSRRSQTSGFSGEDILTPRRLLFSRCPKISPCKYIPSELTRANSSTWNFSKRHYRREMFLRFIKRTKQVRQLLTPLLDFDVTMATKATLTTASGRVPKRRKCSHKVY